MRERRGVGVAGGAFSSAGRIGPVRALLVTAVAAGLLKLVAVVLDTGGLVAYVAVGAVAGLAVAKLFAEWGRRLHDTGTSGLWGLAVGVVAAVAILALTVSALRDEMPGIFVGVWIVTGIVAAAGLLRPGTRGDNRFGPPPPAPLAAAGTVPGSLAWGIVAALGGALIGYTTISISEGMRDSQAQTRAYVEAEAAR